MDLWNINTVKGLFRKYNCNFSKSLGQNFLTSQWVCPKIVEMAGICEGVGVIEIGPGVGVLTTELAKKAKKVVAIEIDKSLIPVLEETLSRFENVKIINQDFLKTNLDDLLKKEFNSLDVMVCANLPYYITSQIIICILRAKLTKQKIKSITVMVQKEMAKRIVALPGSRESNVLSLMVRYYSTPKILFDVASGNFTPRPKVDSSVISLDLQSNLKESFQIKPESEELLFDVIKAAFSQRRKTLANSLSSGLKLEKNGLIDLLKALKIDPERRAESLLLEDYFKISNKLFLDNIR